MGLIFDIGSWMFDEGRRMRAIVWRGFGCANMVTHLCALRSLICDIEARLDMVQMSRITTCLNHPDPQTVSPSVRRTAAAGFDLDQAKTDVSRGEP